MFTPLFIEPAQCGGERLIIATTQFGLGSEPRVQRFVDMKKGLPIELPFTGMKIRCEGGCFGSQIFRAGLLFKDGAAGPAREKVRGFVVDRDG